MCLVFRNQYIYLLTRQAILRDMWQKMLTLPERVLVCGYTNKSLIKKTSWKDDINIKSYKKISK